MKRPVHAAADNRSKGTAIVRTSADLGRRALGMGGPLGAVGRSTAYRIARTTTAKNVAGAKKRMVRMSPRRKMSDQTLKAGRGDVEEHQGTDRGQQHWHGGKENHHRRHPV